MSREDLALRMEALEAANKGFSARTPETVESIRRIAESLRRSCISENLSEAAALAGGLTECAEIEIPGKLEQLLALLKEFVPQGHTEKIGILIVDDDLEITVLLQRILGAPNREIRVALSASEAEKVLAEKPISLIVLDLVLPDTDGRNFLVRLRQHPATAGAVIIILSGKTGVQVKTECFALGADDFYEKPFNPETLSSAVAVKLQRQAEVVRESRLDALTGLPNRAAFCEAFDRAASLANRQKEPLSVGILDLDHFKRINDTYGHLAGDQVLRRVAAILSHSLRKSDMVARWGGEEFVVLFPSTLIPGAVLALEKALQSIRAESFETGKGTMLGVTFSAGVVEAAPGVPMEEAVAEADRFLYRAKTLGRNHIISAESSPTSLQKKILLAEDDAVTAALIRHRLTREGFEVLYCPDGDRALAVGIATPPSLILMDVKMPGLDGFELIQRFRQTPSLFRTPIVMLTSMGSERDINRAFELGANDYIVKPFSPVELVARVLRLLK